MANLVVIPVSKLAHSDALGGAAQGEHLLSRIIPRIPRGKVNAVLVFDFQGIVIATTSYLRASVMNMRKLCAAESPPVPVVVANAELEVREELEFILSQEGDAMVLCQLRDGELRSPRILGRLEPMQEFAFRAVLGKSRVDAPGLAALHGDSEHGRSTKWNNRLVALARKGLILESTEGRRKFYRPLIEGMKHGA